MSITLERTKTVTTGEAAEQFLDRMWADVEAGDKRTKTIQEYSRILPGLMALETTAGWSLGEIDYSEVSAVHIKAALAQYSRTPGKERVGMKLADGTFRITPGKRPAPMTVNGAKAALGAMFREIDTAMGIERPNPVRGIRLRELNGGKATKPQRTKRFLTPTQCDDLVALTTPAHRLLVQLIIDTGLRSAEARGLRWQDIDLDAAVPILKVTGQADETGGRLETTKTATSRRTVPLIPRAVEALREQKLNVTAIHGKSDLVFPTSTGRCNDGSNLWRSVQKASGRAGVGAISVHDLRHSFAKNALHRGVPLDVVSQVLGHADPSVTASVYLSAEVSDADKLAALIGGAV